MFGLKRNSDSVLGIKVNNGVKKVRKNWHKIMPYIFGILIIIVVINVIYVWKTYLYNKNVSKNEISQYIVEKNKDGIFEEVNFDRLKEAISARQEKYNEQKKEHTSIFYNDSIQVIVGNQDDVYVEETKQEDEINKNMYDFKTVEIVE